MSTKIKAVITEADVQQAYVECVEQEMTCLRSRSCPVAQALRRLFPDRDVSVGISGATVGSTRYQTTSPTWDFIDQADRYLDSRNRRGLLSLLPFTAVLEC